MSKIKVQGVDKENCKHAGQCYRMNVMSNSKLIGEKENNSTCTPRNGEKDSKLFRKKRRRKKALKNKRPIVLYAHWSGWNWYAIMLVKKVLDKFIPLWSQFNNIHSDFLLVLYKKHLRDTYVSFNLPESRMTSVQLGCHLCWRYVRKIMLRSVNEKNYLKTWWILNYSEHLIYTLSPKLDKVSYVYINPDKSEPQKSHDYRHVNVSKKVCFQNVLYPASNLSRGSGHGGGGGGDNTLHFSPLRATSPKRACSKCFASILNRKVDIFKWFIHFQDGVFEKITRIRWNTLLKLAKRCLLSLNVISGLIRSPPPSPAVYNLLLTREEGTIYSWNHRCERDWCLQIAIRKDWFQIERIPGQRETGLCTYGTQAPTGYHCLLLWL